MKKSVFRETAFLDGLSNWGKATTRFKEHEKSNAHRLSVEKHVLSTTEPITAVISGAAREEQKRNSETFLEIISPLGGLARSGVAIRGHLKPTGTA